MLAILGVCARGINDYRHKLDAGRLCTATSGHGVNSRAHKFRECEFVGPHSYPRACHALAVPAGGQTSMLPG